MHAGMLCPVFVRSSHRKYSGLMWNGKMLFGFSSSTSKATSLCLYIACPPLIAASIAWAIHCRRGPHLQPSVNISPGNCMQPETSLKPQLLCRASRRRCGDKKKKFRAYLFFSHLFCPFKNSSV